MKEKHRKKSKDRKEQRKNSFSEKVKVKWFCCAFQLGFLQLICTASLIFMSNFELPSSIISKERELYKSKHAAVECRCLEI